MEMLLIPLVLFLIVVPIVLSRTIPIYESHCKVSGDIVNYDSFMQNFVYKIRLPQEQILPRLTTVNANDELRCVIDPEGSTLTFSDDEVRVQYAFSFREYDGFSILRLSQKRCWDGPRGIPYRLNPYIVRKLDAEIVPYEQHEVPAV